MKITNLVNGPKFPVPEGCRKFAAEHDYLEFLEAAITGQIVLEQKNAEESIWDMVVLVIMAGLGLFLLFITFEWLFVGISTVLFNDFIAVLQSKDLYSPLYQVSLADHFFPLFFLHAAQVIFISLFTVLFTISGLLLQVSVDYMLMKDLFWKRKGTVKLKVNADQRYLISFMKKLNKNERNDFAIYEENHYKLAGFYTSLEPLRVFHSFEERSIFKGLIALVIGAWMLASTILTAVTNIYIFPWKLLFNGISTVSYEDYSVGTLIGDIFGKDAEILLLHLGLFGFFFLVSVVLLTYGWEWWLAKERRLNKFIDEVICKLEEHVHDLIVQSEQQVKDWTEFNVLYMKREQAIKDLQAMKTVSRGYTAPIASLSPIIIAIITAILSLV
ncbi:MAG: hypothetical protein ACFFD4_00145 [Candidatus Odinarchaeota archaeon]